MMTVYDALEKRHVMPRAWDDWADYRKQWSDWIIRYSKRDTSILIVGAGACNDYDLEHFSKFYGKIYLFDLEEQPMQEGLRRVPAARRKKFKLLTGDFLGIQPQQYQSFCVKVQGAINRHGKGIDLGALAEYALPMVEEMYTFSRAQRKKLVLPWADYVAVAGVHSQVNHMLPWIWEAYMQAIAQREGTLFQRIAQENSLLMEELNDKLLASAGRRLFVAAEKSRAGVPGGVEGAHQALGDLKRRVDGKNLLLTDSRTAPWPFDLRQGMIYEMEQLVLTTDPSQK